MQIYTSIVQRHKLDVRVVPFGGKKGTSLVRKGTSKAKKEQAIGYWFSPWSQKQTVEPTR